LAILATIAFLSFGGYTATARDGQRTADLASISDTLDLYQVNAGSYPTPDNAFTTTYLGGTVWNQ